MPIPSRTLTRTFTRTLSRTAPTLIRLTVCATALMAGSAWAIGEFSGTRAQGKSMVCIEPLTSLCTLGPVIEQAADGALLQTSAAVAMSPTNRAVHPGIDFAAQAAYDPAVLQLPVLKAMASSNALAGYLTTASAGAVQAYTHTGPASQTFALIIQVDATVIGPNASVSGGVIAYADDYLSGTVVDGPGTLLANPSTFGLTLSGSTTKTLSFTLDSGESVYLETFLSATARSTTNGVAVADAFNTMTMHFEDATGLVVATPVPEPGTLALWGAGLAWIAGLGRRRSRAG